MVLALHPVRLHVHMMLQYCPTACTQTYLHNNIQEHTHTHTPTQDNPLLRQMRKEAALVDQARFACKHSYTCELKNRFFSILCVLYLTNFVKKNKNLSFLVHTEHEGKAHHRIIILSRIFSWQYIRIHIESKRFKKTAVTWNDPFGCTVMFWHYLTNNYNSASLHCCIYPFWQIRNKNIMHLSLVHCLS